MACNKPLQAYSTQFMPNSQTGKMFRKISFKEDAEHHIPIQFSCGQCIGCRLERSRQWATRCMHEASLFKNNCFITLTYSDEHLPSDKSLHYEDFQLFMKRFRKRFKGLQETADLNSKERFPIRFYMAGEYGERFQRPHFHALIFNFDFQDKELWQRTSAGSRIFRSKDLESLWPFGYSSIGELNFESAAYVARYVMKKAVKSDFSPEEWKWANCYTDIETGEIHELTPEFNKMSLKPGIGANWLEKFQSDVYPHDYVVINGKKCKPPKYYDKKIKKIDEELFEVIQFNRVKDATLRIADNTPARLAVKEEVLKAKLSRLVRTLD